MILAKQKVKRPIAVRASSDMHLNCAASGFFILSFLSLKKKKNKVKYKTDLGNNNRLCT